VKRDVRGVILRKRICEGSFCERGYARGHSVKGDV